MERYINKREYFALNLYVLINILIVSKFDLIDSLASSLRLKDPKHFCGIYQFSGTSSTLNVYIFVISACYESVTQKS